MRQRGRKRGAFEVPLSVELGRWLEFLAAKQEVSASQIAENSSHGITRQHVHKIFKAKVKRSGVLPVVFKALGVRTPPEDLFYRWCYVLVRLFTSAPDEIDSFIRSAERAAEAGEILKANQDRREREAQ